jgi:hypothetical protein
LVEVRARHDAARNDVPGLQGRRLSARKHLKEINDHNLRESLQPEPGGGGVL